MSNSILRLLSLLVVLSALARSSAFAEDRMDLKLQYRVPVDEGAPFFHALQREEAWEPEKTALIICDMWDLHHCRNAVLREQEMAPRLNQTAEALREKGVTVIHAPSSCMKFYSDHAARKRAVACPVAANLPEEIDSWCHQIPEEEAGDYPIDQSDGGEDDDPDEHAAWAEKLSNMGLNPRAPWTRQISTIGIDDEKDYISDSGSEVWNILEHHGIENVLLAGVHTNMCVLGRPFGLRQMKRNGKNVVLIRDLTDTMYNPEAKPYVNHFTGTDLILEHIEKFVCPTISSDQVLGDEPFRYSTDVRPRIVILVAEREYKTDQSLARYASSHLGKDFKVDFVYADSEDRNHLVGLEVLEQADLMLVSVRRRTLLPSQLALVKTHVQSGKPVVGIRTASHAFCLRGKEPEAPHVQWLEFDRDVFGGSYTNHHGNALKTQVTFRNITHPIFSDLKRHAFVSEGSLYRVRPLAKGTTVLMQGRVEGHPAEPVAWTYHRADGGRSFYTSLGHVSDFEQPVFRAVLLGGIHWAIGDRTHP